MRIQESEEMYLETILVLKNRGTYVRSIDVAAELNYSRPSVSRAVGILQRKSYITVDEKGEIEFTPSGRAKAEGVYERHCVISRLLIKLGASEALATENACRIEHVIDDELFELLKKYESVEVDNN